MNKKEQFLLWLLALALWGILMPIRAYSLQWAMVIHSIAFAILTWWTLRKYVPKTGFWRPLIPVVTPWIFELLLHFVLDSAMFSLLISFMPLWSVATVAFFYRYRKIWLLLLCAALWLFGVTEGHRQWVEWIVFGEKPLSVNLADCTVSDSIHTFKLSEFDAEYLMLDVWYSQCGVCLREMPEVEALHNEYKGDDRAEVVSLFACLIEGERFADGYRIVNELGCEIPIYAIEKDNPLLSRCDINSYPRVLILDKKRTVIFNGSLEFAKRKLKGILEQEKRK